MKKTILIALMGLFSLTTVAQCISLAGQWDVSLDNGQRRCLVSLPGTIDTNHLGMAPTDTTETTHLTRLYAYKGVATYERNIDVPTNWGKNNVLLTMERTKPTWVYVDGNLVDSCNFISTPQRYVLPQMKPGKHTLTIVVDNSRGVPEQIYGSSHAYTEDTQTNWNGIIGEIILMPTDSKTIGAQPSTPRTYEGKILPCFRDFHVEGTQFVADGHKVFLRGKHDACVWPLTGHVPMDVESWAKYFSTCKDYGINHVRFHSWCPPEAAFVAADTMGIYLQPELPFWGDFNDKDNLLMDFLRQEGDNIMREYGHHPSFRMFALGNELWGSIDMMRQFVDRFRAICPDKLYTFGSNYYLGYQGVKDGMDYFTTCRIGGEGWGNYSTHTRGSFSFADAYDGGMINHFYPSTLLNFDEACDKSSVPIISHETGQFQTYPDCREISKYTGVLRPYNLETFRRRLVVAGMLEQAKDFHLASGYWSVKLYKADIEMDLRTRNMAGFQLLDIQDYPGQGSAYVGILDAFMQSKGITNPTEWRSWCSPVAPLLLIDRFCFTEGDTLRAKVQISNYGASSLKGKTLSWSIFNCPKTRDIHTPCPSIAQGSITIDSPEEGLIDIGDIMAQLNVDGKAEKVGLVLTIDGTEYKNYYDLWVYPRDDKFTTMKHGVATSKKASGIIETKVLTDEVIKKLERGAKVLWTPTDSTQTPHTVNGLFQTDYWNYRMFKTICENNKKMVSPGTLGILTDPSHPVFNNFPTEMCTNWQWFSIIKASHPLILDNFPADCRPIVQVIDNVERNHKLGLLMEFAIGKGKLLVCMSDIESTLQYPEGRAFRTSLLNYMKSSSFRPACAMSVADLRKLLTEEPRTAKMKELNNISQY